MDRLSSLVATALVVLALTPVAEAQAQQPDPLQPWRLLELLRTPAISGFEGDLRNALHQPTARVDEAGNLILSVGEGKPHVLVCADMDEDGFFVSAITDDGYLRVHRVTTGVTNRLFEQMHYGQPMWIRTQAGKHVPGVFVTASSHLQRGRDPAAAAKTIDDLWIDVGAQSRAEVEKLGVQILDPVSLRERSQVLAGGRVAGMVAQTRAADHALALLALSATSAQRRPAGTVTIAWTTQGSFGARGMARLAQEFPDVDRVIVVARTPMARDANNQTGAAGHLGGGVLVADNDTRTIELAKQQGVEVQALAGVLRAPTVWPSSRTQVLALPVLYAQTPVETVDLRDVTQLTALLRAMTGVPEVKSGEHFFSDKVLPPSPATLTDRLRLLIDAVAVSGAERPVRDLVVSQLSASGAKPQVDERGNVTVTFGPTGTQGKELVFVAHMDEIGYEITGILDDGSATVRKRGGFFDYLWEAHPVLVATAKSALVPAVVAPRPNYLRAAEAAPKPEEVTLYFGTTSRAGTEALGVAKGNTATIRKQLTQLAGSRWTARAMDDRCGVAALLEALGKIDPAKVRNRVTFAFVVGEETGLEGSGFLAQRSHPAAVFAIDTFVSSDSPVDPQRMALVPLGSGAVARAIDSSSITPPDVVARVVSIGRAHQLPVVPSTTSGGNDGSQFSRYGSFVVPLSWPGRYSHSPVEVMDLRDLNNLVGLITALVNEF